MKRVAVEANLSPVRDYLSKQGYQVDNLEASQLKQAVQNQQYTAVVVSGMDNNIMGMQNLQVTCPVVNADGLTPEDVYKRVNSIE